MPPDCDRHPIMLVLMERALMRINEVFPAKMRNGFALDNA